MVSLFAVRTSKLNFPPGLQGIEDLTNQAVLIIG